ncbi:MAG: VOC family protein [Proteobacteria bacterium]|nr:VOC family protein [Burkholderiales bacterium]
MSRPPVFHILGLDHAVLRVRDLARMQRFYCDVLGCTLDRIRPEFDMVHLRAGNAFIDLLAVDGRADQNDGGKTGTLSRNLDHLCLRIEPFDTSSIIGHLAAHGVRVDEVKTRYGADGFGPSIHLDDPEGNRIELKGAPTPQASTRA